MVMGRVQLWFTFNNLHTVPFRWRCIRWTVIAWCFILGGILRPLSLSLRWVCTSSITWCWCCGLVFFVVLLCSHLTGCGSPDLLCFVDLFLRIHWVSLRMTGILVILDQFWLLRIWPEGGELAAASFCCRWCSSRCLLFLVGNFWKQTDKLEHVQRLFLLLLTQTGLWPAGLQKSNFVLVHWASDYKNSHAASHHTRTDRSLVLSVTSFTF